MAPNENETLWTVDLLFPLGLVVADPAPAVDLWCRSRFDHPIFVDVGGEGRPFATLTFEDGTL